MKDTKPPAGVGTNPAFMEFMLLVRSMRKSQKHYFETKAVAVLREAKDYERKVDQALALLIREAFTTQTLPGMGE
jgi:hypothetical protein